MRDQQITGRLELLLFFIYFLKRKKDCTKFLNVNWISLILCIEKKFSIYKKEAIL